MEIEEIIMTDEQIRNIKFKFIGHLNTQDFHITTYKANNVPFELYMSKLISRDKLMEYLHNAKI